MTIPDIVEVIVQSQPAVVQIAVPGPQGTPTIPEAIRVRDFRSLSEAEATQIDQSVGHARTAGFANAGDGGEALYKKVLSEPSHSGKFQSADGAWWELASEVPNAKELGAKADNSNNDAPLIEKTELIDKGGVILPFGTYKIVPNPVSPYYYANSPSNLVYRGIALIEDNMKFEGRGGATLHGVSRVGVLANDVQPVFATEKNSNIGDINNLEFKSFSFDPENDLDLINSNQRLFYLVGLKGGRFRDLKGSSSGNRRGYFSHIHNSSDLQINGYRHNKVTGGWNFRFVKRVTFTDFLFYDFSEALDFDGTQEQILLWGGHFESLTRTNQCIDLNSQVDAIVGGFSVKNVGNIITVNHKTTTPDNYADYVSNAFVKNQSNSRRILISDIVGSKITSDANPSIYIGWDWSSGSLAGEGAVSDITIKDVYLSDTGLILVRGSAGLRLRDIYLEDVLSTSGFAAVHMFSHAANTDQLSWDDLDVEIDHLTVKRAQRGSISISAPSRAKLLGIRTEGGNTLGGAIADLILTGLHTRAARVHIDDCDIEGNVTLNGDSTVIVAWAPNTLYKRNALVTNDSGKFYRSKTEGHSASSVGPTGTNLSITDDGSSAIAAWTPSSAYLVDNLVSNAGKFYICFTAGTSAASGGPTTTDQFIQDGTVVWRQIEGYVTWEYLPFPYSVRWGRNNRVRGSILLQGDMYKYLFGGSISAYLGDIAATGSISRPVFTAKRRTLITSVNYVAGANIVASDTNFRSLILRRSRAAVLDNIGTINTNLAGGSWTALVPKDGGVTGAAIGAILEPGDVVLVNTNSAGTGVAITGLSATVNFIEY